MAELEGKVAVITGAASGIGLGLARVALARGMKVALADVESSALEKAVAELDAGDRVLPLIVDVADADAVQAMANTIEESLGPVFLLCNNAGVGGGGPVWEARDWAWVLGVNLGGVINGIASFVPRMIERNAGYVVNTASIAGLMSARGTGTYTVSKHAVVALSEVLWGDLQQNGSQIGVSVLCPSFVNTQVYASGRNRPAQMQDEMTNAQLEEEQAVQDMSAGFFEQALSTDAVAQAVFAGVDDGRFYILTHPQGSELQIQRRFEAIRDGLQPATAGAEDFPLS